MKRCGKCQSIDGVFHHDLLEGGGGAAADEANGHSERWGVYGLRLKSWELER